MLIVQSTCHTCISLYKEYHLRVEDFKKIAEYHLQEGSCLCYLVMQVSFVFTNQIEGKLVPVESMRRPKMQAVEESRTSNNFKRSDSEEYMKQKLPVVSAKPVQIRPLKSIRSSLKDVTNLSWRTKLPLSKQLPLKRSCHTREGYIVVD